MYNFIDTTEVSEVATLPSEALQINGQYIENLIQGYRTLSVAGREALSPELSYFETGARDGSKLQSKRFPARIITVTYQLIAESCEAFREAYNQLGKILNVEDAELIFNDEPDKYFVGTPETIGAVAPGKNAVTGEFEILCLDPFKYSVVEYEATATLDEGSVLIDYNGTYKSFPILEADFYDEAENGETETELTGKGDCGFVAFFDENEHIIQLGDPDEVDGEEAFEKSQTLMNQIFPSATAWGATAKALWAVNSGAVGMKVGSYSQTKTREYWNSDLIQNNRSPYSEPTFVYNVKAKTSNRTATSVKAEIAVTTNLLKSSNYFGYGYGLAGSIYANGVWHDFTIKTISEYWKGNTGHTVNLSFTIDGLTESQFTITDMKFKVWRTDSTGGTAGVLPERICLDLMFDEYKVATPDKYFLGATDYGTGDSWHGASITRQIGADATGEVGATHFYFYSHAWFGIANSASGKNQLGLFDLHIEDADGNSVTGIRIYKNKVGNHASLIFFVNGKMVNTATIDVSYAERTRAFFIRRNGSNVQFTFGSYTKHFTDADIADVKATQVTYSFKSFGSTTGVAYNGVSSAKFVKNNCDTFKDIPNKFGASDVLEADCKNGEILLNGVETPELGALGNDWEEFYLTPGLNQIGFAYSDWTEEAPTIKVRYREVFL